VGEEPDYRQIPLAYQSPPSSEGMLAKIIESGARRQESGVRRQELGDRGQGTGDRGQGTGDRITPVKVDCVERPIALIRRSALA
jgi:hypothetical protein